MFFDSLKTNVLVATVIALFSFIALFVVLADCFHWHFGADSDSSSSDGGCPDDVKQIRKFILEDGQFQDLNIYRLEKGWTLEFHLGSSLRGHQVKIFTNYPFDKGLFQRNLFRPLNWFDPATKSDLLVTRIELHRAGPYQFYYTYDNNDTNVRGSGYFLVNPSLCTGNYPLRLDAIQYVTYTSTGLGPFSKWEKKLQVAKETGYNVIHFTALQELGSSQSAYSISDFNKVNPVFQDEQYRYITWDNVAKKLSDFRKKYQVLSVGDLVLNHAAPDSPWLQLYPEAAYNLANSPYLKPAYVLDILLYNFGQEIANGSWETRGIPRIIETEQHLQAIKESLNEVLIPNARIEEFYIVPVDTMVAEFYKRSRISPRPVKTNKLASVPNITIIQDPQYQRLKCTVDMDLAMKRYNVYRNDTSDEDSRIQKNAVDFRECLESLNYNMTKWLKDHLNVSVTNEIKNIQHNRVEPNGPKWKTITDNYPLFPQYFMYYKKEPLEAHMNTINKKYIMAHNGWLASGKDSEINFADPGFQTYLRREVKVWDDTIKLWYGDSPESNPILWNYMRMYVEQSARVFDGIRLDNHHSTPIHVAEYMVDAARRIKSDILVIAELFTLNTKNDNMHINRVGINSMIRASRWAFNLYDLGDRILKYSDRPSAKAEILQPTSAHAVFFDLTHDDGSPLEKFSIFDMLPNSATVALALSDSGSTMGYDQLVPVNINYEQTILSKRRLYMDWSPDQITLKTGIMPAKKMLNSIHYYLGMGGYTDIKVYTIDPDIIGIKRKNNNTNEAVMLFAYTVFKDPDPNVTAEGKSFNVSGVAERVLAEAYLEHTGGDKYAKYSQYIRNNTFINGLTEYSLIMKENTPLQNATMAQYIINSDNSTTVQFTKLFAPGSIFLFKLK